ncbi:MAG: septal ring lytic transglycosylase RlpA family protein [Candidatus Midichloria sp.]|nr:septal ring lytic transglycosylase RlpA family protein [Candidatus Midichloria sp.]
MTGGPVPKDRILDVSEQAAESLGFKGIGLAKVKVEYLLHHSKKLLENVKSDKYSVICNYFAKNRKIFQD